MVGYWDFGETKHPVCVGVDHMGADWSVDNGEVLSGVHCNITRFIIPESHTVSVREWDGGEGSGKVEIYAKVFLSFKFKEMYSGIYSLFLLHKFCFFSFIALTVTYFQDKNVTKGKKINFYFMLDKKKISSTSLALIT